MKKTLKDLQNVLPIGYFSPTGSLEKTFNHKSWQMEEERQVGRIKESDDNKTMGPFVSELMALMVTKIGNIPITEKTHAEKRLTFSQMHMSDVMYMYAWLRRESLGPDLKLISTCPMCSFRGEIIGDLDTLECVIPDEEIEKPDDLIRTIELRKGVMVDGETYHEIKIKPTTWMAMETFDGKTAANDGAMKCKVFQDSAVGIVGLDRDHFVMTDDMMNTLYKVDIELLNKAIDELNGGLIMSLEHKCERCSQKYFQGIDWNYENFFSHSSIPSTTKS